MPYENMQQLNKLVYSLLEKVKQVRWRTLSGLFGISEDTLKQWHYWGALFYKGAMGTRVDYTRKSLQNLVKFGLAALEHQLQEYAEDLRPILKEIESRIPLARFTLKVELECDTNERAQLVADVRAHLAEHGFKVVGVW